MNPAARMQVSLALKQIEYYFSDENLAQDVWLRQHFDAQGFIPIAMVAKFRKVSSLGADLGHIVAALEASPVFEVDREAATMRPADRPLRWVFPMPHTLSWASAALAKKQQALPNGGGEGGGKEGGDSGVQAGNGAVPTTTKLSAEEEEAEEQALLGAALGGFRKISESLDGDKEVGNAAGSRGEPSTGGGVGEKSFLLERIVKGDRLVSTTSTSWTTRQTSHSTTSAGASSGGGDSGSTTSKESDLDNAEWQRPQPLRGKGSPKLNRNKHRSNSEKQNKKKGEEKEEAKHTTGSERSPVKKSWADAAAAVTTTAVPTATAAGTSGKEKKAHTTSGKVVACLALASPGSGIEERGQRQAPGKKKQKAPLSSSSKSSSSSTVSFASKAAPPPPPPQSTAYPPLGQAAVRASPASSPPQLLRSLPEATLSPSSSSASLSSLYQLADAKFRRVSSNSSLSEGATSGEHSNDSLAASQPTPSAPAPASSCPVDGGHQPKRQQLHRDSSWASVAAAGKEAKGGGGATAATGTAAATAASSIPASTLQATAATTTKATTTATKGANSGGAACSVSAAVAAVPRPRRGWEAPALKSTPPSSYASIDASRPSDEIASVQQQQEQPQQRPSSYVAASSRRGEPIF